MKTEPDWDSLTDRQWSIHATNKSIRALSEAQELRSDIARMMDVIIAQDQKIKELRELLTALAEIVAAQS